jgi:hypothetical protein
MAAALAMCASFLAGGSVAAWYVMPWLKTRPWPQALTPLLVVHLFRHVALQLVSAQRFGFAISDAGRDRIVYGDLVGFTLALLALVAIRTEWVLWKPLVWVFVAETVVDLGSALAVGVGENLFERASGVSWLILTFYVPVLWITIGLMVWQLATHVRRTFDRANVS